MADSKKQVRARRPPTAGDTAISGPRISGAPWASSWAIIGRYKGALIVVAVCLILSSAGSVAGSYFLKPAHQRLHRAPADFTGLFWTAGGHGRRVPGLRRVLLCLLPA